MSNNLEERRAESRTVIDEYYSLDFSIGDATFVYQFKIWDLSSKGMCLLIKEDSEVLKHLKAGEMMEMQYYKEDSSHQGDYMKTKIMHITKDDTGRFKGHYLVGISLLENPNSLK